MYLGEDDIVKGNPFFLNFLVQIYILSFIFTVCLRCWDRIGGAYSLLIYSKALLMYKLHKLGQKVAILSCQTRVLTIAFGRDTQCACFVKHQLVT